MMTARSPAFSVESATLLPFFGSVSPGGTRRIKVRSVVVTETSSPLSLFTASCFASAFTEIIVPEIWERLAGGVCA